MSKLVILVLAASVAKCSARGGGGGGRGFSGGGSRRRQSPTYYCCCDAGFKYQSDGNCTSCHNDEYCPADVVILGTSSRWHLFQSPSCGLHQHKCQKPPETSLSAVLCWVVLYTLVLYFRSGKTQAQTEAQIEAKFTAKAESCNSMGHPLVQLNCADLGSDYRISWICDNCNQKFMRSKQPNLLHCHTCGTDFCNACKPLPDTVGLTAHISVELDSVRVCVTNLAGSTLGERSYNLGSTVLQLESEVRKKIRTDWIYVHFLTDSGIEVGKLEHLKDHDRLTLKGIVRSHIRSSLTRSSSPV